MPAVPSLSVVGTLATLRERLGAGACGQAWLAEALPGATLQGVPLPHHFVIKFTNPQYIANEKQRKLAMHEAQAPLTLSHPFVVRYFGAWIEEGADSEFEGCLCIGMEHCDGGDFRQMIRKHKQASEYFSDQVVMTLAAQMLSAVAFIHHKKLLHRDIKPANIFITRRPSSNGTEGKGKTVLVLGDFGLSRGLDHTAALAVTRVGTAAFCSPEIIAGEQYSGKTDVWSVGVVLYELMSFHRPFAGPTDDDNKIFQRVMSEDPIPRFKTLCANRYSSSLLNIVSACLAKQECDRPTAYELLTSFSRTFSNFVRANGILLPPERSGSPLRGVPVRTASPLRVRNDSPPPTPTNRPTSPVPRKVPTMPKGDEQKGNNDPTGRVHSFVSSVVTESLGYTVPAGELQRALHHDEELLMIVKILCLTRQGKGRRYLEEGIRGVVQLLRPDADANAVIQLLAASG